MDNPFTQRARCMGAALLLCASTFASAADGGGEPGVGVVRYALHPANVVEASGQAQWRQVQSEVHAQWMRLGLATVSGSCVQSFLATQPRRSCEADEACLAQLGRACGAQRVVWIAVAPSSSPSVTRISGKIVRADHAQGIHALDAESPKTRTDTLGDAVHDFLVKLLALDFSGSSAVAGSPAPSAIGGAGTLAANPFPPGVETPAEPGGPSAGGRALRDVGIGIGALGAASLVASGIIALASLGERAQLGGELDPSGQRPDMPEAARLSASLNAKSVWVTSTLVGGAALLVSGAACTYVGIRSSPSLQPTVLAGPGGAGLALLGRF